jgi:ribosomal protein S4E
MSALAKPDPFPRGSSVLITGGTHAGKTGTVQRAWLGRPEPLNVVYVELDGGAKGWSVSVPVKDLQVCR